jgi:hypothetical protein
LSKAELERKQIAELRKRQLIEAGLIPNLSEATEEGDEKKTGMVSRKRKAKKVKEEGKEEVAENLADEKKDER